MRRLLLVPLLLLVLAGGAAGAVVQPNDPAWSDQWALRQVHLPQVWGTTTGDPNVVIAIVDTGVNPISDVADNLAPGWDFVDNDAVPQDTHSHGTRVASVLVGRGNNGLDLVGHCWGCRLMPVRVSANGSADPRLIAGGIYYAVAHGARIISISLTRTGQPDFDEAQAVAYAIAQGVLVIASAGNAGNEAPQYPGAYPGVLAVGATDDSDTLYFWSTRGRWVTLTAPGCHMVMDVSTRPGTICGTSFTPAAVAGVAGLLLSRNPSLTAAQLTAVLVSTARPVDGVSAGRVDALAAFQALGLLAADPPPVVRPTQAPKPRVPGQLFAREVRLETGTFRRGVRLALRVGRGRLELQLKTPYARDCALALSSASGLDIAPPAVQNLLSFSEVMPAGRYTVQIECSTARSRNFTLGLIGMFPVPRSR